MHKLKQAFQLFWMYVDPSSEGTAYSYFPKVKKAKRQGLIIGMRRRLLIAR